ncbi:MAG: hypothetical protein LQ345_004636 [Seirophora villosa]|nr:MAG: hypothetical protein LQ345_004636 [Seirophora villosa]
MQFSTLFIAAALPFLISTSPTGPSQPRAAPNKLASRGIFDDLKGPPPGCSFGGGRQDDPYYIDLSNGEGDRCFGFDPDSAIRCGGPYEQKEIEDLKAAVKEQATKDGFLKSTKKGDWTAVWGLLTTSMEDPDTSAFDEQIDAVNKEDNEGVGKKTYYWQRKNGYITVRRTFCPGS